MEFAAFLLPAGAGSLDYCAGCCLPRPDGVRRARWTGEMGATGRGNKNGPVPREGAEPQYLSYSEIILLKVLLLSNTETGREGQT